MVFMTLYKILANLLSSGGNLKKRLPAGLERWSLGLIANEVTTR